MTTVYNRNGIPFDIDNIATDLNGKADRDLTNCTRPYVVESYRNGTSWYRVWSDGWCEQGNDYTYVPANGGATVTLLKPYSMNNSAYSVFVDKCTANYSSAQSNSVAVRISASQIWLSVGGGADEYAQWYTCGYIN